MNTSTAPDATGIGKGVRIAILDSGIDPGHPSFGNLVLADDLAFEETTGGVCPGPGEGRDLFGHGTAVCGIIHQLVPAATLGSFRVLGSSLSSRSAIVREAALLAIEKGYHILNCSFGCSREDHIFYYKSWVDMAYLRGRHVVAASNNSSPSRCEWPGHFTSVIAATFGDMPADSYETRTGSLVEFVARGVNVLVPWVNHQHKSVTGSSFAAAHMTAVLARKLASASNIGPLAAKEELLRGGSQQSSRLERRNLA